MKKRKVLIRTLLATFVCTLVSAVCTLVPWQAEAETVVTYGTPVVYDLWDLKGKKEGTYNSKTTRKIGKFESNRNVAFKTIITDDYYTDAQKASGNGKPSVLLSWVMLAPTEASDYTCNGYGYQLHFRDGTMSIFYDADPTDGVKNQTVGASAGWETMFNMFLNKIKDLDGKSMHPDAIRLNSYYGIDWVLEFGCKDILTDGEWTGNYVYAKVNDIEVLSFVDENGYQNQTGTYFGTSSDDLNFVYYGCRSTYDFVDVKMGEAPEGATFEKDEVVSLVAGRDTALSIPLEDGYAVASATLNGTDITDKLAWTPTATTLDCSALEAGEYTLDITTSKNVIDNVTVYDIYDLQGVKEYQTTTNKDMQNIGQFATNNNVAYRAVVSYDANNTNKWLSVNHLILTNAPTNTAHFANGGYGYQFLMYDARMIIRCDSDPSTNNNKAEIFNADIIYTADLQKALGITNEEAVKIMRGSVDFTLEVGCAKYLVNGEWAANYVYAKINGIEVLSYIDTGANYQARETMGTYTGRGADYRDYILFKYKTSYTDSQIAHKLLDTFSMDEGASARASGNGLRFTMAVEEDVWTELQEYIGEDKVYSSVSFGMVIVPVDYVAKKPLTVENLFGGEVYHLMEQNEDGSWKEYNGGLTPIFHLTSDTLTDCIFNGSIVNLEEWNITRKFVGLGYVKYVEDGEEGYVLADYFENDIANNTRSMYQVATLAYEANDPMKDALKTNYLDKVAEITVHYYNADGSVLLATETIYGVIGQTAFAPLRGFEGYTFIAGNNGNATQITVSAEHENVLNYYFAANE